MNEKERRDLVFETISKVVGFEVKPDKEFYMIVNDKKVICLINGSLNLFYKKSDGCFELSGYSISYILKGIYQLYEIQEPLLNDEEREFLGHFEFEWLEITNLLYLFDKDSKLFNATIDLNKINVSFNRLERNRKYSRKELGL